MSFKFTGCVPCGQQQQECDDCCFDQMQQELQALVTDPPTTIEVFTSSANAVFGPQQRIGEVISVNNGVLKLDDNVVVSICHIIGFQIQ
ncbi:hypothetical protein [Paenibacillus sp. YYML68]|uniref:hypothetical protein n=1 Tax=Paenibacillus sp. YYML68 TaxID=2909250 RepID=UPI0024923D9A|nr:hypothetical protein [Paenibacillus sp. YYML68]